MKIEFSIDLDDFVGNEGQTFEEIIREILIEEVRRRIKKHPSIEQYVEKAANRALERMAGGELL